MSESPAERRREFAPAWPPRGMPALLAAYYVGLSVSTWLREAPLMRLAELGRRRVMSAGSPDRRSRLPRNDTHSRRAQQWLLVGMLQLDRLNQLSLGL